MVWVCCCTTWQQHSLSSWRGSHCTAHSLSWSWTGSHCSWYSFNGLMICFVICEINKTVRLFFWVYRKIKVDQSNSCVVTIYLPHHTSQEEEERPENLFCNVSVYDYMISFRFILLLIVCLVFNTSIITLTSWYYRYGILWSAGLSWWIRYVIQVHFETSWRDRDRDFLPIFYV